MSDTIVWISGATGGIGRELRRQMPFPGARVINIDIRKTVGCENVHCDLLDPQSWDEVAAHFQLELNRFSGKRVIFLQQAYVQAGMGLIGKLARDGCRTSLVANFVAPIMLAEAFLRASRPGYELGLMLMSSGSARGVVGQSAYGAAKSGLETWVRTAQKEFEHRPDTWIVAVRPGSVKTQTAIKFLDWDEELYPRIHELRKRFSTVAVAPELAARRIWKALPPTPSRDLISFDDSLDETPTM
jgi:NAD(P)-dependent dehydrogenase (short-subunit alcohol dehydrogenase family)